MNIVSLQKLSSQDSWRAAPCSKCNADVPPTATHLLVYITDAGSRVRRPLCDLHANATAKEYQTLIQEPLAL